MSIKPLTSKKRGFPGSNSGFTLIELIITLTVSLILTAMVIPYAYNYIQRTQALKTVKEMKAIANAENLFYANNTQSLNCTVTVSGTNYNETELYHIYTSNFQDLINSGSLANDASDINYFGYAYGLNPDYSPITVNPNNYCVRQAGIEITTYIPAEFAGIVKDVPGAFDIGINGNTEEVGYYMIPRGPDEPEQAAMLKYNW